MKCVVCKRKISGDFDVCKECDELMDMLYKKNPEDKDLALKLFREEASGRSRK